MKHALFLFRLGLVLLAPGTSASCAQQSAAPRKATKPDKTNSPFYPVVKEETRLLKDAVAAWDLNDGGLADLAKSALPTGAKAMLRWGIWLNDPTFGKVLDFSTEGSRCKAPAQNVVLGKRFSVAAWIKAPIGIDGERMIMAQGTAANFWQWKLSAAQNLVFQSSAITSDTNSGYEIGDGKWHHVLVSYDGQLLSYFVDQLKVRALRIGAVNIDSQADIYIGSNAQETSGFEGSIARVRIFNRAKTPSEVTSIAPPDSANKLAEPILKLKRGIVIDRRQYASFIPPEYEKVYAQDVDNCRNMGFDHIKVLFTPNHLMNRDGSLIIEKISYFKQVVDRVVAGKMNCLICIHPEVPFKQTYLVEGGEFEKLIRWYGELARFIGEHWTARQVALQLMTEPYANTPETRWTWMSDRMTGAVRNCLPDHTIVTSSDRSGNLERLKRMQPATDSNLIYSFTTYEPYTAGFNIARATFGNPHPFWNDLRNIPYPANPTILDGDRIEQVIRDVPAEQKDLARRSLQNYAAGKDDGGDSNFSNLYGGYYDASWHLKRAQSLDEWSRKFGGVHLMCVEFGCMDAVMARKKFTANRGAGLIAADRINLIRDLRRSFEAYGIGWSYWSYNDPFTVFLPEKRIFGRSPDAGVEGPSWFDYDLLQSGLGLTPKIKPIS